MPFPASTVGGNFLRISASYIKTESWYTAKRSTLFTYLYPTADQKGISCSPWEQLTSSLYYHLQCPAQRVSDTW